MMIPEILSGDLIEWCGHSCEVLAVESRPIRRRQGRPRRAGRILRVLIDDGNERRLHYFDDEHVDLVDHEAAHNTGKDEG